MLIVTVTERTPTEDRTDLNTYHRTFENLFEAAHFLEDFELNFGVLVSITITPLISKNRGGSETPSVETDT